MWIRASHALAFIPVWTLAVTLAGCRSAQPSAPVGDSAAATNASDADEAQRVADAALGRQAEILDRGDLARNGREQVLVVNRLLDTAGRVVGTSTKGAAIVSRAVVLEKSENKWREIFRCDEHLKNPYGYLIAASNTVTGWELAFGKDASGGLEMEFRPARTFGAVSVEGGQRKEPRQPAFIVRWNTKADRYQGYDASQKRYLRETTALETPESILK